MVYKIIGFNENSVAYAKIGQLVRDVAGEPKLVEHVRPGMGESYMGVDYRWRFRKDALILETDDGSTEQKYLKLLETL